jgi:hypothetical protein
MDMVAKRSRRVISHVNFFIFSSLVLVGGLIASTILVSKNQQLDSKAWGATKLTNAGGWQYLSVNYNSACSYPEKPAPDNYQAVHPSVLYFPGGWKGYKFWMSVSPFPNDNAKCEHPHVFASNTGRWKDWIQPTGNPVVPSVDPYEYEYSDADLMMVGNTMYMFYRRNAKNGTDGYEDDDTVLYRISLCSTCNSWSIPQAATFVNVPGDQNNDVYKVRPSGKFASPSIFYENSVWRMYYVDTIDKKVRYAYSNDGINFRYLKDISADYYPQDPWHVEVFKYQTRYFMLLNQTRAVPNPSLYLLTNDNTANWTNKGPILSPSSNPDAWDKSAIYRASAVVVDNQLMLWYSGFKEKNVHTGLIIDSTWNNWWYR